eukprot:TRINITY_DN60417_c0_g1_i1.p1 TRINITY_DN60417_c0_g1~~TRINITY_DN60417_c0_g1_i1.p1  ORF type:complete len:497 (+),score=89.05 TRINITY_DN60417_c0_g1_i1:44-1534(+)
MARGGEGGGMTMNGSTSEGYAVADWVSAPWTDYHGWSDAHAWNWSNDGSWDSGGISNDWWHSSDGWWSLPASHNYKGHGRGSGGKIQPVADVVPGPPGASGGALSATFGSHSDEHTARVHFGKTHQVLGDIMESHPDAFKKVNSFLDLGCAPGGFVSRLLEAFPSAAGFGVTLPVQDGGFPMLITHAKLNVQCRDLMGIAGVKDLGLPDSGLVDVCTADAQDLGRRTTAGPKGRRGKGAAKATAETYDGGVGAVCGVLGIWALTLQEVLLALSALCDGGTFIFRFAWRGRERREEAWYRQSTHRLLAFVYAHFKDVSRYKSEFSHQAHSCFYLVCSCFRRDQFVEGNIDKRLEEARDRAAKCSKTSDLPWCMEGLAEFATSDFVEQVDKMLEEVGRLRQIGLASRQHVEETGKASPEAALWISPVPFSLTLPRLRERLERYGKIVNIKRRSHPIGVGADALVQFMQPAHASQALEAINQLGILGPNITVQRMSDCQ